MLSSSQPVFKPRLSATLSLSAMRLLAVGLRAVRPQTGLARVTATSCIKRLAGGITRAVDAKLVDGRVMRVDLRDFNGRMLMLFGQSDPKVIRTCNRLLRPGDIFLDVGANHGEVGLLSWARTQPTGHVHIFEPIVRLASSIEEIARRDGMEGLSVHQYGLGQSASEMEFSVSPLHTGRATRVKQADSVGHERQSVRIMPTSQVLRELVGNRCVGVKIDVEGAEMDVLPSVLGWASTKFVVFECEHLAEPRRCCELIRSSGFDLFGLEKRVWSPRYRRVGEVWDRRCSDVVAVKRGAYPFELDGVRI